VSDDSSSAAKMIIPGARSQTRPPRLAEAASGLISIYRQTGATVPSVVTTTTMTKYTTTEHLITPVTRERTVYIEQVEAIPDDAAVFHYDELDETLKHRFPALSKRAPTEESVRTENVLSNGDYVKFTEYYQVTCQ
jgi:hypothetical protein